jgi:hypothetical protein
MDHVVANDHGGANRADPLRCSPDDVIRDGEVVPSSQNAVDVIICVPVIVSRQAAT